MRKMCLEKGIKFPLYRFTQKKWANCFFSTGQLRLGTLFDYAKNESYGDAIHDLHEGHYVWRPSAINGVPQLRSILARNNLLLCSTTDYSESLYDAFDANCCIRINSINFFNAIDQALSNEFTPLLLRKVTYYNKLSWECVPDYEDFAGVMKDSSYMHQQEVRALWEPMNYPFGEEIGNTTSESYNNAPNPLIAVAESKWYEQYSKKQREWLKPKTVFVPEARQYCTLLQKYKT